MKYYLYQTDHSKTSGTINVVIKINDQVRFVLGDRIYEKLSTLAYNKSYVIKEITEAEVEHLRTFTIPRRQQKIRDIYPEIIL